MKGKNNKFQKGDVVFYTLPKDLCFPWQKQIPVKVKTVFSVEGSYRYLVEFLDKEVVALAGKPFHYVDETSLLDPDVANGYV